jgi:hypothetical protein
VQGVVGMTEEELGEMRRKLKQWLFEKTEGDPSHF